MEISLENLYVDFGRIQTLRKGGGAGAVSKQIFSARRASVSA